MASDSVASLNQLIRQLREDDRGFRVFGSKSHRYSVRPVLSEKELVRFEDAYRVKLPADYREFLAAVGNGGAGPDYGLEPLGAFGRRLSAPFPLTSSSESLAEQDRERLYEDDELFGILEFCHHGCGIYSYLVVKGPAYGTVWTGQGDFVPTGFSFDAWFKGWAETALRRLQNEKLVSGLREGMTTNDVNAAVPAAWKKRAARAGPVRYFEAPDIPVRIELDENDIVVKLSPWLSL